MFSSLEEEVVRVLRASLSPRFVASDRVQTGLLAAPATVEPPLVVVSAFAFRLNPDEAASPPRASRSLVQQSFGPNSAGPLLLSNPPLQPLRSVELEAGAGGARHLLNERDDFTVDYVNGRLRLRESASTTLHVSYFTAQPLRVLSATRLRVEYRVDVFGGTVPGDLHVDTIVAVAAAALQANAGAIDGLRGASQDVVDLGLPGSPGRKVFCVFEAPIVVGGSQLLPTHWRLDYAVDAWQLVVPVDQPIGVIRHVAAGVAWDGRLVGVLLSETAPLLGEPVTVVLGVGPATAVTLAERGITTVGELADAPQVGPAQIDTAIGRARAIRDQTREVSGTLVAERPRIDDPAAFLGLRLAELELADLTAAGITTPTATTVLAATAAIVDNTTLASLTLGDVLSRAPTLAGSLSTID